MAVPQGWSSGQWLAYRAGTLLLVLAVNLTAGAPWQWFGARGHDMELGVSFSCRRAKQLLPGVDCQRLFETMLDDLGARWVRLALYWDEIEPEPGRFEFGEIDGYVAAAEARGVKLLPIVGMKSAYRPEFFFPPWLKGGDIAHGRPPADDPEIAEATLRMLMAVTEHLARSDAIEAWQVENEPDVRPDADKRGWTVPNGFLAQEIAAVRRADPRRRPVIVTDDSSQFWQRGWIDLLGLADGLGVGILTRRPNGVFPGQDDLRRFEYGAFAPDIWHQVVRADFAEKFVWLVEVQAEPWEGTPATELRPDEAISISPSLMRSNITLARRTGASRAYLWGAEWWWYARERWGDGRYWDTARELVQEGD